MNPDGESRLIRWVTVHILFIVNSIKSLFFDRNYESQASGFAVLFRRYVLIHCGIAQKK